MTWIFHRNLPHESPRIPVGDCSVLGFAFNSQARHSDRPNRVRQPTDWQFVSGCSPPRLAATQLPSTIEARFPPRVRTYTSLIWRAHRRTSPGFGPFQRAPTFNALPDRLKPELQTGAQTAKFLF
jgi:hypothetical protein